MEHGKELAELTSTKGGFARGEGGGDALVDLRIS